EKAKGYSLPKDKIKTAIDKAFGSGKDAANYETVVYEGYGPCGVAILCEALTDNRNRTAADVRAAFTHAGGNLGTSGSVSYMFERKGQIMVPKEIETGDKKHPMGPNGAAADEEEFEMAVIEAGGDDYEDADEEWIVYTQPSDLMAVKKALEEQGVQVKGAEMTMEATTPATVTANDAKKVMRLVDKLEELEDLQNVYHTMDITEEIAAALDE
uniref:YebC/PmpR family DNA-binding transcriptional regulator n=2 Tax=Coriobacteriaceae TaxID=84107 RepID=UPI00265DAB5B